MAAASPIDAAVNPNNTAQRYVLWSNGRIDAVGGAPPITDNVTWYARFEPPAVALHITNWTDGSGYTLDYRGGFHAFGSAPDLGTGEGNAIVAGIPLSGSPRERLYVDWAWDPAGTGQGYVLDLWGQLLPFGGATAPPRAGRRFASPRGRRLEMRWTPAKNAITMDMFGRMYGDFTAFTVPSRPTTLGVLGYDNVRDFAVSDWTTSPPSGHILDLYGGTHEFGSAPDARGFPYRPGADVARILKIISPSNPTSFWQVWSGGQSYDYVSSTAPTVTAGGSTPETQKVTITGTPTGGTFTLTYSGQTTAAIAYNATAATVQTALIALSNIGPTDVVVTGGPGPGSAWLVTFGGTLLFTDPAQMTATSSLTGGTAPAVTVTTTAPFEAPSPAVTVTDTTRPVLAWDYSDPQADSQAAWQLYVFTQAFATANTMTDPSIHKASALVARSGINRNTRGITSPVDLPNGTYRFYIRAQDTSGLWSAWSNYGWTQNVPVPVTPTSLSATANTSAFTVALSVTATTGGSADLVRFEFSDDSGVTWTPVVGAEAVTLASTTTATDRAPALGVTRTYRAIAYAVDPAVASLPSSTASAAVNVYAYVLTAVADPTAGGSIRVQEPVEWERPVTAGVFQGLGADFATVVSDGQPKGRRTTVHLLTLDRTAWGAVEAAVEADSTLVYRDPFGTVMYCRLVDSWRWAQLLTSKLPTEATPVRHAHDQDLPLVEVGPPTWVI